MNLYYLSYNNYINRIVKKESSLSAYLNAATNTKSVIGKNFTMKDGVEQTIKETGLTFTPDYILVCDNNNNILSHWFVINTHTNTKEDGVLSMTIRRDVIVEHFDKIIEAPCFIEKATIPFTNPLIFNSEGMNFNKIKKSEVLLKDETETAWVVGYIPRDAFPSNTLLKVTYQINPSLCYNYNTRTYEAGTYKCASRGYTPQVLVYYSTIYGFRFNNEGTSVTVSDDMSPLGYNSGLITNKSLPTLRSICNDITTVDSTTSYNTEFVSINAFSDMCQMANQLFYDSVNNKYYRCKVACTTRNNNLYYLSNGSSAQVALANVAQQLRTAGAIVTGTANQYSYGMLWSGTEIVINYEEVEGETLYIPIPSSTNRAHVATQAYDIFAIPLNSQIVGLNNTSPSTLKSLYQATLYDTNFAYALGSAISSSLGSADIYDIQLLPYCPFDPHMANGWMKSAFETGIDEDNGDASIVYCFKSEFNTPISSTELTDADMTNNDLFIQYRDYAGAIFWLTGDTRSFIIPYTIDVDDVKISNECDMYRLCSPNWNGIFEFNPAKNGGVHYFNVHMTCKVYNPYINISPDFSGLYGGDYTDGRGLDCKGDFSLPLVNSAWANYQLQNKNYENQFNRQIESMELNNKWSLAQSIVGAGAGVAQSGVIAGMINPIAGAVTGVASLGAGIMDIVASQSLYQNQKSYATDMYNYNLENIKAIPSSLTKIGCLTATNKIFPVLEYYTCTDEEKEALKQKLYYNGMTVMVISAIANFMQDEPSFIQGRIIRLLINEDSHIINEIINEIARGVYI